MSICPHQAFQIYPDSVYAAKSKKCQVSLVVKYIKRQEMKRSKRTYRDNHKIILF